MRKYYYCYAFCSFGICFITLVTMVIHSIMFRCALLQFSYVYFLCPVLCLCQMCCCCCLYLDIPSVKLLKTAYTFIIIFVCLTSPLRDNCNIKNWSSHCILFVCIYFKLTHLEVSECVSFNLKYKKESVTNTAGCIAKCFGNKH